MIDFIKLLLAILIFFITGDFIYKFIFKNEDINFPQRLALSLGLGIGGLPTLLFYLSFIGLMLNLRNIILMGFILLIARISISLIPSFRLLSHSWNIDNLKNHLTGYKYYEIILIFLIIASFLIITLKSLSFPIFEGDGITYAIKSKILFSKQTIYNDYFFDLYQMGFYSRYPLLLSIIENFIYVFLGHTDDRLVRIIFPLIFLSLLLLFYSSQKRYFSRLYSLFWVAVLATLPAFLGHTTSASDSSLADMPLSFFITGGIIYSFLWIKSKKEKDLIISSLFFVFAVMTKNEGLGLFLINAIILSLFNFLWSKENINQRLINFFIYSLFPSLLLLPWWIFCYKLPQPQAAYLLSLKVDIISNNLSRIKVILPYFINELFKIQIWNLLWIILLLSTIFTIKNTIKKPLIYLALVIISHFSIYVLIFIITPMDVDLQINWSLSRLFLHITPVALFLISNQIYVKYFYQAYPVDRDLTTYKGGSVKDQKRKKNCLFYN